MVAWLLPVLATGGAYLAGKGGSGGAIELFTTKKSTQITDARQTTTSSVYSPTITRNVDIQYNIATGGSEVTTKKDAYQKISPTSTPTISPIQAVSPTTAQGGGIGGGSAGLGIDPLTIALFGGLGFGAYYLLTKNKRKK